MLFSSSILKLSIGVNERKVVKCFRFIFIRFQLGYFFLCVVSKAFNKRKFNFKCEGAFNFEKLAVVSEVGDAHKARGRVGYILRKCNDWIYSHGHKSNFYAPTENFPVFAKTKQRWDEMERSPFNKKLFWKILVKVVSTFIGGKTSAAT